MEGRRSGIDYSAIVPTAGMIGVTADPATFAQLRIMEAEALAVLAVQR